MLRITGIALICLFFTPAAAEARQRHAVQTMVCDNVDVMRPCKAVQSNDFLTGVRSIRVTMHRVHTSELVAHPAGCPARAFCGCGAAVRVFGSPIRSLWLAANWYKFPRTSPAPGAVAVRRHHVFVLEQHLGGDTWLAFDANSGHHATRLHARSIAGYTIVNPHV